MSTHCSMAISGSRSSTQSLPGNHVREEQRHEDPGQDFRFAAQVARFDLLAHEGGQGQAGFDGSAPGTIGAFGIRDLLGEPDLDQIRFARDRFDRGPAQRAQLPLDSRQGAKAFVELRICARAGEVVQHCGDQLLLGTEMPEQRRFVHARTIGDFTGSRAAAALVRVQLARRSEDTQTRLIDRRPRRLKRAQVRHARMLPGVSPCQTDSIKPAGRPGSPKR